MKPRFPFRFGTTSYVFPADSLSNVKRLASVVDDIELVLFDVDDQSSLSSRETVAPLRRLAKRHKLTYAVHLPLDLRLAASGHLQQQSLQKACWVIQSTLGLDPWAYVIHLNGAEIHSPPTPRARTDWLRQAARSLETMAEEIGIPDRLAVENLDSYSPCVFSPLLDRMSISLCVDIGHLINRAEDPLAYLEENLARTCVIHLHGSRRGRDHKGLDEMDDDLLASLLGVILSRYYHGVLTLEVFLEQDFLSSKDYIHRFLEARI